MRITLPLSVNKEKLAHMEEKEKAFAAKKVIPVIVKTLDETVKCCSKHSEFIKTCKSYSILIIYIKVRNAKRF